MTNPIHIFYYSRKKLGLYLVFNILLLALAVVFTLTIFPEYPAVYYFALASCVISVLCAFLVFAFPLKLAIITPKTIKIDRAEPLNWSDIRKINKVQISHSPFGKTILRLEPKNLKNYHLNFMQRLIRDSQFGAFSIPLYAMNEKDARAIERLIRKTHAAVRPKRKKHPKD